MSKYIKLLGDFFQDNNICHCGCPDQLLIALRDRLNYCKNREGKEFKELEEDKNSPYNNKESLFIHYMMASWDMTEHGGSVNCAWLSESGKEMLKILDSLNLESEEFDIDDYIWEDR